MGAFRRTCGLFFPTFSPLNGLKSGIFTYFSANFVKSFFGKMTYPDTQRAGPAAAAPFSYNTI